MPVMTAEPLTVSRRDRSELQRMARSTSLPHRTVRQAKALLWAADGVANEEIARRSEVDADAVRRWRRRFEERGVDGVGVIAKGRGRKSWLPEGTVAEVVRLTMTTVPPDGSTQWSTRTLGEYLGIGKDTVARIWRDHNLRPWQVKTFKVSNDPNFAAKIFGVHPGMRGPDGAGECLKTHRPLRNIADRAVGNDPEAAERLVHVGLHLAPEGAVARVLAVEVLHDHDARERRRRDIVEIIEPLLHVAGLTQRHCVLGLEGNRPGKADDGGQFRKRAMQMPDGVTMAAPLRRHDLDEVAHRRRIDRP